MKNITIEQAIYIQNKSIDIHGGTHGIKNIGLVESSLNSGLATFSGEDLYPTIEDKISMISYSFIKNHGFEDGNKRVGITVLLVLSKLNGINLKYTQKELISLGLGVAEGSLNKDDIKGFLLKKRQ